MNEQNILKVVGSAYYDTYKDLIAEALDGGYEIEALYVGADRKKYHDYTKLLIAVAVLRGAKTYKDYVKLYDNLKREDETDTGLATENLFARFTGVMKVPDAHELREVEARNREYRKKYYSERAKKLKQVRLMVRVDDNIDFVIAYIKERYSHLL